MLVSHTPERQRAAAAALFDAVRDGRVPEERLRASAARVAACAARVGAPGDVRVVGAAAHRAEVARAARAAVRVTRGAELLPLCGRVGALTAGRWSRSIAEDEQPEDAFVARMVARGAVPITLDELDRVDAVLVALRRVTAEQRDALAARLRGRRAAVVALREPYALDAFGGCTTIAACDEGPAFLDVVAGIALP